MRKKIKVLYKEKEMEHPDSILFKKADVVLGLNENKEKENNEKERYKSDYNYKNLERFVKDNDVSGKNTIVVLTESEQIAGFAKINCNNESHIYSLRNLYIFKKKNEEDEGNGFRKQGYATKLISYMAYEYFDPKYGKKIHVTAAPDPDSGMQKKDLVEFYKNFSMNVSVDGSALLFKVQ